jgi:2-phosphosulfolactate phosphatase
VKIDCQLIPGAVSRECWDPVFVVVDVLRATSTMVTAFMNGCTSIVPVADVEEAFRLANGAMGDALIGGERGGLAVKGFDLGNSPREYTAGQVQGKMIIMTTTNGSRAFRSLPESTTGIVASFLNLGAVARYCLRQARDFVLMPSGREGGFSLEDTVCAGGIVEMVRKELQNTPELTDAALASGILYDHARGNLVAMFRSSVHGRYLMELGMEKDLEYCAQTDVTSIVPIYRDGRIGLTEES